LVPIPCYVSEKCCGNNEHIKNAIDADFVPDIDAAIELIEDLLEVIGKGHQWFVRSASF
jgi:hypothetical protein